MIIEKINDFATSLMMSSAAVAFSVQLYIDIIFSIFSARRRSKSLIKLKAKEALFLPGH